MFRTVGFAGRDLIREIYYILFSGTVICMPLFKACKLPANILVYLRVCLVF